MSKKTAVLEECLTAIEVENNTLFLVNEVVVLVA